MKSGLSKSAYIRGLQCHKRLWLSKYRPELRDEPDAATEARFTAGNRVGDLAKKLYPGGVEIEFEARNFKGMLAKTAALISQGQEILYEATFERDGILVLVDILVKENDKWHMLEVKSSSAVKPYHLPDAAIQWYVAGHSIPLFAASIVHINTSYVRRKRLNLRKLFKKADITDEVLEMQSSIPENLAEMRRVLAGPEPLIDIGDHCTYLFVCDFYNHCHSHIPQRSVFNLYRMQSAARHELYQDGILDLGDLPDDYLLTHIQAMQVEAARSGRPVMNQAIITDFLRNLQYPLVFLDFETMMDAIPRFEGQSPYQQIPFQYSMHIQSRSGRLRHREFLADEFSDPRKSFTDSLIASVPKTGTIIAYNMSFEKMILRSLAVWFPEYSEKIDRLLNRFADPLKVLQSGGYYHPDFNGSFSIKSVLPAIFPDDPELSYQALSIRDGQMAMDSYTNLHLEKDANVREQIRNDLLQYCKLDTLAMIKIIEKLQDVVGD